MLKGLDDQLIELIRQQEIEMYEISTEKDFIHLFVEEKRAINSLLMRMNTGIDVLSFQINGAI